MRLSVRTRRIAFTAALVMVLLFAQSLGLLHRIAHADWQPAATHSLLDAALFDYDELDHAQHTEKSHSHSCAAFDEATLAASVHAAVPALPVVPGTHILSLWQAFASWDAPVVCHFSSRAPPR